MTLSSALGANTALLFAFLALQGALIAQSEPVISELMAINDHTLADEDNDWSDWLEVHNPTSSQRDLGGWYLTDDSGDLTKWMFPSPTTVPAGGFLVVFASNKDRAVSGQELHTNFKFKSAGEYVGLVKPDGATIAHEYATQFPQQYADVSYGLGFNPTVTTTESYFSPASPGAGNGNGGPVVFEVFSTPELPGVADDIVVSATGFAYPGLGISSMELRWRHMYSPEQATAMVDDGSGYDQISGDGIWTAHIPAGSGQSGDMLRWAVRATDTAANTARAPLFLDPLGSPEYFGTVVDAGAVSSNLPVYHWFVEDPSKANFSSGTRSSIFHDRQFYDNIFVRRRGNSSTGWTKKNYKFDFNRGDHFRFDSSLGRVEEFNLNSCWSDKTYFRRVLAWETYGAAQVASCLSFSIRVQQNNSFFSLATFVEQVDEDLLERNDLDGNGALYKMFNQLTSANSGVEKKTREWEDHSDLQALVSGCQLSGPAREQYLFDNVDLPAVINYIAATTLMHDNDHVHKNYYLWRDSDGDLEWQFLPWDKDLTFGRNYTLWGGVLNDTIWADNDPYSHPLFGDSSHKKNDGPWNRLVNACHSVPQIQEMYLRRLRSLMDAQLQSPSTPANDLLFENRVDELAALAAPEIVLDEQKWGIPSWGNAYDSQADISRLKTMYLAVRRDHLFDTHGPPGVGIIPPEQRPEHIGFGVIEDSPLSGNDDEEYIQLRNDNSMAVDLSGWALGGGVDFVFSGGSVIPAGGTAFVSPKIETFRSRTSSPKGGESRLVFGPYTGHVAPSEELFLFDHLGLLVDTTGAPALVVRNLIAGEYANCEIVGGSPKVAVGVAFSLAGSGSAQTSWGTSGLAVPIGVVGVTTTGPTGFGKVVRRVPLAAQGLSIWLQGLDFSSSTFTNVAALTVG